MFIKFHRMLAARRRRRALIKIRREFARWGYPLDGMADRDIEAALPPGACENPPDHLGAKTIGRALRRLSIDTRRQRGGEATEAVIRPEYGTRERGTKGAAAGPRSNAGRTALNSGD